MKSKKTEGLTLLEVLVSAMLLAFILVGLANIFVTGKRYILHSRSRITAAELTKLFLEPLAMQVRQDQWDNNCLSNNSLCTDRSQTIDSITYNATYQTNNAPIANLRKVVVNISWHEPSP